MRLSVTPSTKCSCSGSPPILANGRTTIERRGGRGFFGRWGRRGLRLGGRADFQRIDPDRLGDVLELGRAEIADREIEPPLHLPVGVLGETDRAGLANAFEPRGDIDAVAHQIAVGLLDDIAEMNADAELDAALGRHAGVALDHAVLHLDRASHRVDDAAKLDEAAVAGALDDAPMMRGDGGVNQIAAQRPQPRQRALLVRPSEPAVADDIGDQDRCDFPGLGHSRVSDKSAAKNQPKSCRPSHQSLTLTGIRAGAPVAGSSPRSRSWRIPGSRRPALAR